MGLIINPPCLIMVVSESLPGKVKVDEYRCKAFSIPCTHLSRFSHSFWMRGWPNSVVDACLGFNRHLSHPEWFASIWMFLTLDSVLLHDGCDLANSSPWESFSSMSLNGIEVNWVPSSSLPLVGVNRGFWNDQVPSLGKTQTWISPWVFLSLGLLSSVLESVLVECSKCMFVFFIERNLEDHECLSAIQKNWANSDGNKFIFRKDFTKYEFYKNPNVSFRGGSFVWLRRTLLTKKIFCVFLQQFFPPSMVDTKIPDDNESLLSRADRYKNILLQVSIWPSFVPLLSASETRSIHRLFCLQNMFSSDRLPDIQGYMQIKEGKRSWSWKKYFFVLRPSGLYYSTKGTSKVPVRLPFDQLITWACGNDCFDGVFSGSPEFGPFLSSDRRLRVHFK